MPGGQKVKLRITGGNPVLKIILSKGTNTGMSLKGAIIQVCAGEEGTTVDSKEPLQVPTDTQGESGCDLTQLCLMEGYNTPSAFLLSSAEFSSAVAYGLFPTIGTRQSV